MSGNPQPNYDPAHGRLAGQKRPVRRIPWLTLLLISGVVLAVYGYLEGPREIGRWYLAAAAEHWTEAEFAAARGDPSRAAENREQAFDRLEEALRWSPEEPLWIAQRAQWLAAAGKHQEALEDCNLAIEKLGERTSLLGLRMTIYQQLGRHAEAVKDSERINDLSKTSGNPLRPEALNNLAYAKAIGKIDLDTALKEINESLRIGPENALFLDTRGFVRYQKGDYALALEDLQRACRNAEKELANMQKNLGSARKQSPDPRLLEINLMQHKRNLGVIFYHRALIHEKLGHAAAARADHNKVKELIGREGDETLF